MIRFRVHGNVPRTCYGEKVYGLISRNTFYGLHRQVPRKDFDRECSKSTLLFFTEVRDAQKFAQYLDTYYKTGRSINRISQENTVTLEMDTKLAKVSNQLVAKAPVRIEPLMFSDVEQICLLQYLDLYLSYGFRAGNPSTHEITLDCYEYRSMDPPSRPLINKLMEDLLRKK